MIDILKTEEFHPYYKNYIALAKHTDIVQGLEESKKEFVSFAKTISDNKWTYAYAPEKWSIAEVLQHIIDTERIFAYRALRFARKDKTPIVGFEQDDYVPNSGANQMTIDALVSDYQAVRSATISLFHSFSEEMLVGIGNANGANMSARAVGYMLVGHQQHHLSVLQERYL